METVIALITAALTGMAALLFLINQFFNSYKKGGSNTAKLVLLFLIAAGFAVGCAYLVTSIIQ